MLQSAEEFVILRTSDNPAEYHRAAHDEAPEAVWLDTIRRFPDMKIWVVRNKTVPLSMLYVLASDADPHVRWEVATKRKLDAHLFDLLSRDPDEGVRHCLACNRKIPLAVLQRLAADDSPFVRDVAVERLATATGGTS